MKIFALAKIHPNYSLFLFLLHFFTEIRKGDFLL